MPLCFSIQPSTTFQNFSYLEYNEAKWTFRIASVLEPLQANQMELDTKFSTSRGDNIEFEHRFSLFKRPGAVRVLLFENHANMGNYRSTIDTPSYNMDVAQSRSPTVKYGIATNVEQAFSDLLGVYVRASINDGHTETWAFTEIDQSLAIGAVLKGTGWKRSEDTVGAALVVNGLSDDHRDYLARGGYGFIVGDGKLNYAPEEIIEIYYLLKLMSGLDLTGDFQFVNHPAYNIDRGPVPMFALRLHYEN